MTIMYYYSLGLISLPSSRPRDSFLHSLRGKLHDSHPNRTSHSELTLGHPRTSRVAGLSFTEVGSLMKWKIGFQSIRTCGLSSHQHFTDFGRPLFRPRNCLRCLRRHSFCLSAVSGNSWPLWTPVSPFARSEMRRFPQTLPGATKIESRT